VFRPAATCPDHHADRWPPDISRYSCDLMAPAMTSASIFLWAAARDRLTIREPHRDYYGTLLTVLKITGCAETDTHVVAFVP
jgi:hypothetical protein